MTPKQQDRFRERLLQLRVDLSYAEDRGREGTRTVELDQQAVGRLSRMDALQNQAMAQAGLRHRAQQQTRIQAALDRIDDGSFGECLDCGEDIPPKRLELDPTLAVCVSCASG